MTHLHSSISLRYILSSVLLQIRLRNHLNETIRRYNGVARRAFVKLAVNNLAFDGRKYLVKVRTAERFIRDEEALWRGVNEYRVDIRECNIRALPGEFVTRGLGERMNRRASVLERLFNEIRTGR
jgi:hypothetical protein